MLDERRRASTPCCTARRLLPTLAIATVALHVVQIVYYADTEIHHNSAARNSGAPAALQRGASNPGGGGGGSGGASTAPLTTPLAGSELMIVTATQPSPCTTQSGDFMVQLGLKNKWQYALLHGHRTWVSTELLSPWDLGGQWNKLALLSALAIFSTHPENSHPERRAALQLRIGELAGRQKNDWDAAAHGITRALTSNGNIFGPQHRSLAECHCYLAWVECRRSGGVDVDKCKAHLLRALETKFLWTQRSFLTSEDAFASVRQDAWFQSLLDQAGDA